MYCIVKQYLLHYYKMSNKIAEALIDDEFIDMLFTNDYFRSKINNKITEALTDDEFIDTLFTNDYFCSKITTKMENLIKSNKLSNTVSLCIDKYTSKFITTLDEFIKLNHTEIESLYELNEFESYSNLLLKACIYGKIIPQHIICCPADKMVKIFRKIIEFKQTMSNIFNLNLPTSYYSVSIGYILIEKFYNFNGNYKSDTKLTLDEIIQLSQASESVLESTPSIKTIDDYYKKMPECMETKHTLFHKYKIYVNYLKDFKINSYYLKIIFESNRANLFDYFQIVFKKFEHEKFNPIMILEMFEIKNKYSLYFIEQINLSHCLTKNPDYKNRVRILFEELTDPVKNTELPEYDKFQNILKWCK